MKTNDVTVLVWDDPSNFHSDETQRSFGNGNVFKNIIQFRSLIEFENQLRTVNETDKLVFACHIKVQDLSLYEEFIHSGILQNYSIPIVHFLSSDPDNASEKFKKFGEIEKVLYYNSFIKKIRLDEIKPFDKPSLSMSSQVLSEQSNVQISSQYPKIKYAIITALYDDEFEEVSKVFDFPDDEEIVIGDKTYYIGYHIRNREIKVVAGIPFTSGMVDASIMATQMIEIFRPNYILMSGVCGGFIDDCNLGDIVIARNVYTFQKGKLSDIKFKDENGNFIKIDLYDKENNIVDYDKLFDKDGNQITISIESFKREDDSVITIDHFKDKFDKYKKDILDRINRKISDDFPIKLSQPINLHYEPMACSTMVVNKEGFFEDTLKAIDRKTIAVEMESYGVARACRYANEGKTKPVIFKSVMDFTFNKSDTDGSINWKKFAAYTSAQFMNYLFENKII